MRSSFFFAFWVLCTWVGAQNFSGGYNFVLPARDTTSQLFLPLFPAAPIRDFITVGNDGHFKSAGQTIRFWGVNVVSGACFPVKEKAPWIAGRMRKMGINLVRFHHMDNGWSDNNGSLFVQNASTTRQLNPTTLDRLHYFLAQLKENQVYANLNLHVSRLFKTGDGILYADSIRDFGKAVTFFDRQLIDLQKEFARQLLTSVNPYTGLKPVDDPVLAMVEITNENTLYGAWKDGWLKPFSRGGNILSRHADTLDRQWNAWLQQRYPTQGMLATAWNQGVVTGGQNEQVKNGTFENNNINTNWQIELHNNAGATIQSEASGAYAGARALRVNVTNVTGTDWHIQFKQVGLSVQAGKTYAVKFVAKAGKNVSLNAYVMRDNDPYTWYNGTTVQLTTNWQEFLYTFVAPETNHGFVRLAFSFNNQTGSFWFDNVSLADPEVRGLAQNEDLSSGTVKRIEYSERLTYTPGRTADQARFYLETMRQYSQDMYTYLHSLGVKVPITTSNAWGGLSDLYTAQDMDYIDDHAYWDHPWFPNQAWSATDWFINNEPMVKAQNYNTIHGIFSGLAMEGKPYTISEYRHASPNRYEVEMMPWFLAYGSYHGADGIMFFDYNDDYNDWEADRIETYFGMHRHHALMGLSPSHAYAFRQGLLDPAQSRATPSYSEEYLMDLPRIDNEPRWGKFVPYHRAVGLTQAVRIKDFKGNGQPDLTAIRPSSGSLAVTDHQQTWVDFNKGLLVTTSPQYQSITGFLDAAANSSTDQLQLLSANSFGVISWLALDKKPLAEEGKSLLTISTALQNTGMVWDGTRTVHGSWGQAPTLLRPLKTKLRLNILADTLKIYPLDGTGLAGPATSYLPQSAHVFEVELDQSLTKTMWFGLEAITSKVTQVNSSAKDQLVSIFPNPASHHLLIKAHFNQPELVQLNLYNHLGRLVRPSILHQHKAEIHTEINIHDLLPGLYVISGLVGQNVFTQKLMVQK